MIKVLSCIKEKENWIIEVESHDLYVDGKGGQIGDQGYIENIKFLTVLDDKKIIVEEEILPGEYPYTVNENRVFDIGVQHTAQHLFSAIAYNDYGLNTVGFRMTETYSTVDLDSKDLDEKFVDELERKINAAIGEGREILEKIVTRDEANSIDTFRKKISDKVVGDVRIITIDTLDTSACAGYHVSNISQIRLFKIINFEKIKGNYTRFYFLGGDRAIDDFIKKNKTIKELNRVFSCRDNEILSMVDKFNEEKKQTESRFKELNIKYCEFLSRDLLHNPIEKDGRKYIVYKDDKDTIANLNKIIPGDYIFIGLWNDAGLISSKAIDCGELLKEFSKTLNIKGGGKGERANFKGDVSIAEITNIL
ncbi:alanyl-tRNA editing protein [Cetobacterium somerae]|uniref:alanyl-tRNA editing protein n=1 Tax=Cetobacterium somerae TaxID=188913 RepID=UPI003D769554